MTEADLRKGHRTMGIILAFFIFLQAASGAMMALEFFLNVPGLFGSLTKLHFGGGALGHMYRIILGAGTMGMAISGSLIYSKIRARTHK
jgi:hypothetical protein